MAGALLFVGGMMTPAIVASLALLTACGATSDGTNEDGGSPESPVPSKRGRMR